MGNIATASTKKNTKVFLLGEKNVTLKMFTFISNIKENYPILLLALKKKKKKKKQCHDRRFHNTMIHFH